jgi:hypothetical protein
MGALLISVGAAAGGAGAGTTGLLGISSGFGLSGAGEGLATAAGLGEAAGDGEGWGEVAGVVHSAPTFVPPVKAWRPVGR